MKRQITIFFVAALAIFGTGYLVYITLMDSDPTEKAPEPKVKKPPIAAEPVKDVADKFQNIVVKSVIGIAERTRGNGQEWIPVEAGNKLLADERIRTEENARVKLAVDDESKIQLEGRSEMSVKEITNTVHNLHLALGKMSVDYGTKERVLKITSDKNKAVAETTAGKFVIQNADGHVSIATTDGEVKFSAEDKTVTVGPNTISNAAPGEAPAQPEPIPLKVMLRVANPKKLREQERFTTIAGKTNVGARVHINDEAAPVDKNGRFRVTVPLHVGRNSFSVNSSTAWGSAEKELNPIVIARSNNEPGIAPVDSAKVHWGKTPSRKKRKELKSKTK